MIIIDLLLKAIRAQLTDATLNAMVPIGDIHTQYNPELADYPCLILSIQDGGSLREISGVTHATLGIDIYSDVNNQECWDTYDRVKTLLHHQEQAITTADRLIHLCIEKSANVGYNMRNSVWQMQAKYQILFSTSSVVATSAVDGAIYADATNVTAVSGKEVGKFRGKMSLQVLFDRALRSAQERFAKAAYYYGGHGLLIIEEVVFKAAQLDSLWSIDYDSSDTLADDSTAATSYTVAQDSTPSFLQLLFQCTKTDDAKLLEIEADKAVCESLQIPFSKEDLTIHNCQFLLLGDSSDNIVKVSVEN